MRKPTSSGERITLDGLTFRNTHGLGPDHFTVREGERKVGPIYRTSEGDWFWGVDYLTAQSALVTDYAPRREEAMAQLKRAWTDMMWARVLAAEGAPRIQDAIARQANKSRGSGLVSEMSKFKVGDFVTYRRRYSRDAPRGAYQVARMMPTKRA